MSASAQLRPIAWWFTRGAFSVITIPVFLILLAGTLGALFQSLIQTYAYVRVTKAVWGWLGVSGCLFIWPFSLVIPWYFWWAAIKTTPDHFKNAPSRGVAARKALFTGIFLIAWSIGMQWMHGQIIIWIADRNPDAAFRAGIIGSRVPSWFKKNGGSPEDRQ